MIHSHFIGRAAIAAAIASALALPAPGLGVEIRFRSFSGSATMGPQFDAYAAKLADTSLKVIGPGNEISFKKITPMPAIPAAFPPVRRIPSIVGLIFPVIYKTRPCPCASNVVG